MSEEYCQDCASEPSGACRHCFEAKCEQLKAKEEECERLRLFSDNLIVIMSDSYRDGMSRASMGLDFDFEYSRTKLLIERGNYFYSQGLKLPELQKGGEGEKEI